MSSSALLSGMLLLLCGISAAGCSPAPAGSTEEARGAREPPSATACPSCALARLPQEPGAQADMVEAVKLHILSMLHLSVRPNITRPVPRAALLNAIKKLHVGRVGQDGSVEIEDEGQSRAEMSELAEQTSEIITFAEAGECVCVNRVCARAAASPGKPFEETLADGRRVLVEERLKPAIAARILIPPADAEGLSGTC